MFSLLLPSRKELLEFVAVDVGVVSDDLQNLGDESPSESHPNACLNCAHFRTDASFLDVHRAELRDTERVITKASANGWTRQIEMNERKRNNLVNIVTSLERTHA